MIDVVKCLLMERIIESSRNFNLEKITVDEHQALTLSMSSDQHQQRNPFENKNRASDETNVAGLNREMKN